MTIALVLRDVRGAAASGFMLWASPFFFLLMLGALTLSLGQDALQVPRALAGSTWVALTLGTVLTLTESFKEDKTGGVLDYLFVSGVTPTTIAAARVISSYLTVIVPICAVASLTLFVLTSEASVFVTCLPILLVGGAGLAAYCAVCAALLSSSGLSGLVALVVVLPLISPLLIFGTDALERSVMSEAYDTPFLGLAGWSLASMVVGILASGAALRVGSE